MNSVYVVTVLLPLKRPDIEVCEVYSDLGLALNRAYSLSNKYIGQNVFALDWINNSLPAEEELPDGSMCWSILETHGCLISVFLKKVLQSKPDNPLADGLPAGWFKSGKPAFVRDLINDPLAIKSKSELSEEQTWALAYARISKRSNFCIFITGVGSFVQEAALSEIKNRTKTGLMIRDLELDYLFESLLV